MGKEKKVTAANRKAGKGNAKVATPPWQSIHTSIPQVKSKVEDIIGEGILPDSAIDQVFRAIDSHNKFMESCGKDEKGRISLLPFSISNFKEHCEKYDSFVFTILFLLPSQ